MLLIYAFIKRFFHGRGAVLEILTSDNTNGCYHLHISQCNKYTVLVRPLFRVYQEQEAFSIEFGYLACLLVFCFQSEALEFISLLISINGSRGISLDSYY